MKHRIVLASLLLAGTTNRAAVLPRADAAQGTPLLLSPQGDTTPAAPAAAAAATGTTSDTTPPEDDITNAITAPLTASLTALTSSAASITSQASSASSSISSSTASTAETTSSPPPAVVQDLHPDPPRQPSNVRYLVPVFLLILTTLAVFLYNKYRKRKAARAAKDGREADPFGGRGGWKEIKNPHPHPHHEAYVGAEDEDEDVWHTGEETYGKEIGLGDLSQTASRSRNSLGRDVGLAGGNSRKSLGVISVTSKGWGWRDTFNNWRSARGKGTASASALNDDGDGDVGRHERDGGEREPTMKLVTPTLVTYHTLPNLEGKHYEQETDYYAHSREEGEGVEPEQEPARESGEERGSIRALRRKLASLSYATSPPYNPRGLERTKSLMPDKRLSLGPKANHGQTSGQPCTLPLNNTGFLTPPPGLAASASASASSTLLELEQRRTAPPPSPPACIRPRAVSPTPPNQILSPPLQPHLFFHPATSLSQSMQSLALHDRSLLASAYDTDDGNSVSEYASDYDDATTVLSATTLTPTVREGSEEQTRRFPRIPSTASALANSFDSSQLQLTPALRQQHQQQRQQAGEANVGSMGRSKRALAPTIKAVSVKRAATGPTVGFVAAGGNSGGAGSRLKVPPSPGRRARSTPSSPASASASSLSPSPRKAKSAAAGTSGTSGGASALLLRRSTALQDLSGPSPLKSRTPVDAPTPITTAPTAPNGDEPPRKARNERTQRKEQRERRARDKVEDILKASWSDRALTSPTPSPSAAPAPAPAPAAGVPGMMSPGMDALGGGIEQRLAMLRKMEV